MKTKNSITWRHRLAMAVALSAFPVFVFGQSAPNIPKEPPKAKEPPKVIAPPKTPKEAPKAPKTPQIAQLPNVPKEVPKTPNVPKPVNIPNPPKTINVPKNPPKVVEAPKVPKVPNVPKAPPIVKVPDAPKVPKTPVVVVKVPDAPKVPKGTPKVPVVAKVPDAPKAPKDAPKVPVVVDVPKVTKPTVIREPAGSKLSPLDNNGKVRTKDSNVASAPPPDTRVTIQGGKGENTDTKSKKKLEKDYSNIAEAYRRLQQSEDAKDDASDPYQKGGAFDRDQFRADERLVADFENEQIGAKDMLDSAKKPGGAPDDKDDDTPVAVTRGRIKDLSRVEGAGQTVGLKGDEEELVDARDLIASGKVKDPKKVDRLVDSVANKGVDQQYGEAPEVSVKDLTSKGDELKRQGKFREARDYYDQAIDALKNGGKNSAGYRLDIIADVSLGKRPANDLARVVKPGVVGKIAGTPQVDVSVGAGAGTTPATAPQDNAATVEPVGQRISDGVAGRAAGKEITKAVSGASTGAASGATDSTAGASTPAADTGAGMTSDGAVAWVSNQLGADTQNVGSNAPVSATTATPGTDGAQPGNNEAQMPANPEATVTSPADEVVLGSPGNNQDFVHQQSADGNTSADVSYHTDGTFTAVVTTVTRDAQGNVTSSTSQTVNGTYTEGDDGERHHTATDATSPTTTESGQSSSDGSGSNDGDDDNSDDDKKDGGTPATTETSTETEATETTEANDDTAEASEEGTPNPEAAERGGRGGRLAEMTGGRLGGDEQRRQNKGLEQRKKGNGAGGPNPEGNRSSGVLLTVEEQKAFAKQLNMKRGGGVTTPNENASSSTVTERDMKDIAARRGSRINPAGGNGENGGSGLSFGKKGFTPGAGGAPAPPPQGAQTNTAVPSSAIQVAPAAAAASAVRGAAVDVNIDAAKVQQGVK